MRSLIPRLSAPHPEPSHSPAACPGGVRAMACERGWASARGRARQAAHSQARAFAQGRHGRRAGGHRLWRNGLGQVDSGAADAPRACARRRPGRRHLHHLYAAATHRRNFCCAPRRKRARGAGRAARWHGWLPGAVSNRLFSHTAVRALLSRTAPRRDLHATHRAALFMQRTAISSHPRCALSQSEQSRPSCSSARRASRFA